MAKFVTDTLRPLEFRTWKFDTLLSIALIITSIMIVYIGDGLGSSLSTPSSHSKQLPSSSPIPIDHSSYSNATLADTLTPTGSSSSINQFFENPYNKKRRCKKNYVVTHMQLAMVWLPGYCDNRKKCWKEIDMTKFYVHGLWPADALGRHKQACALLFDALLFPQRLLMIGHVMIQQLHESWPSYHKKKSSTQYEESPHFWEHEYLQHGSCAELSFNNYFRRVIERREETKIENWLSTLIAEKNTKYTPDMIATALLPRFGNKRFYISCINDERLVGIILCVDKEGQEFISCPKTTKKFGCKNATVTFYKKPTFWTGEIWYLLDFFMDFLTHFGRYVVKWHCILWRF